MSVYSKKTYELLKNKFLSIILIPKDLLCYVKGAFILSKAGRKQGFPIVSLIPIIGNSHMQAGNIDKHYFLQDIYMAKKIRNNQPDKHYDIGSRVDGFISHLLCYDIPVTMIDIRPLEQEIEGLSFIQSDATTLSNIETGSIKSISSLHAVEHFGLSRYGDKPDADASAKAMKELQRVVGENGYLYFSVPISNRNGIVYNSHRVFKPSYIFDQFNEMKLVSFAYIRDYTVHEFTGEEAYKIIMSNDFIEYDCGMFVFKRDR